MLVPDDDDDGDDDDKVDNISNNVINGHQSRVDDDNNNSNDNKDKESRGGSGGDNVGVTTSSSSPSLLIGGGGRPEGGGGGKNIKINDGATNCKSIDGGDRKKMQRRIMRKQKNKCRSGQVVAYEARRWRRTRIGFNFYALLPPGFVKTGIEPDAINFLLTASDPGWVKWGFGCCCC